MAIINGTQGADTIGGTDYDDVITGFGGKDTINGAAGDDIISGGEGADDLLGGLGDDTITGDAGDDIIDGAEGNDTLTGGTGADTITGGAGDDTIIVDAQNELVGTESIDGGDDIDTLVTELSDADDLNGAANDGASPTIWGSTITSMTNMEFVQITNAGDYLLDLSANGSFGFDQAIIAADDAGSGAITVNGESYDATSGAIAEDGFVAAEADGLTIGGTTYVDGDTYTTAGGGSVAVAWVTDHWTLTYTAGSSQLLAVGDASISDDDVADETITATIGDGAGNTVDISVDLSINLDEDIDASAETDAVKLVGDDQNNYLISGEGNDTIIGNGGTDTIELNGGDNKVWAGASDDAGDSLYINGDGNNTAGLGVGNDYFEVNGAGANTLFGGDGSDSFDFYGAGKATTGAIGDNTAWAGASDEADYFYVYAGADGDNVLGGGAGSDYFYVDGDGANTLYLGADDSNETVEIYGDGANTVFGGVGANGTGKNSIYVYGNGANTVFNGNGDDYVYVSGSGDNILWGGVGDDDFEFGGGTGTVAFAAGNGVDTIFNFVFDGTTKVDVAELGFTDASDVLNSMSESDVDGDTNTDVVLFVEPGQAVVFDNMNLIDFQLADPADWLVV